MIEYKEIEYKDWSDLYDRTGCYKITYKSYDSSYLPDYYKDGLLHCEFTAAFTSVNGYKEYYLNGKLYGDKYIIPSDQYWLKYQKLLAFT